MRVSNVVSLFPDETRCRICGDQLSVEDGTGFLCLRVLNGAVDDFCSCCQPCATGFTGGPRRPLSVPSIQAIAGDYALVASVRRRLEILGLPRVVAAPQAEPEEPVKTKRKSQAVHVGPRGRPRKGSGKRLKLIPVSVAIPLRDHRALLRLARLTGKTLSGLIREILAEEL